MIFKASTRALLCAATGSCLCPSQIEFSIVSVTCAAQPWHEACAGKASSAQSAASLLVTVRGTGHCGALMPFSVLAYRSMPETLKATAPGTHLPKLDPSGSKIMNTHSIAQRSQMLLPRRGSSAAKQIHDLTPERVVEEKGITARAETSRLSVKDETSEVEIRETGA